MSTSRELYNIEASNSPRMQEILNKFNNSTDDPHPRSPRSPRSPRDVQIVTGKLTPRGIEQQSSVFLSPEKKKPKFEVQITDMKKDSKNKSLIANAAKEGSTAHADIMKISKN